ncbi:MAG: radical SAM protein [Thermodesulfovibrionales bacterium]
MRYYLARDCALKLLEAPSAYSIGRDELYELDGEGFDFLSRCAGPEGCESGEDGFVSYCLGEGILSAEKVVTRRPPVAASGTPSLRYLELQVTRRCNLACGHCYLGPAAPVDLGVEDVRRALEDFESMQGLRVLITGGEPLLHRRFREINAMLPRYAVRKVLLTNGLLLSPERLEGLNVEEIQVSIDGLEAAHDRLRGEGTFRRAMKGAESALAAGFDVSVATVVHAGNLGDFDGMERLFTGMGVKGWTVDAPCAEGNMKGNPAFALPPETAGRYLGYGFGGGLHGGGGAFACGIHLMSVTAEGYCAKCAFYGERPVGRLSEGLRACWPRVKQYRLEDLKCGACEVAASCRGGCRYRAALHGGDELARDLYRCALYGKL